jgi:hypothetical protein
MLQGILDNAEDFTPEQIATDFEGISLDVVRRMSAHAGMTRNVYYVKCFRYSPSTHLNE